MQQLEKKSFKSCGTSGKRYIMRGEGGVTKWITVGFRREMGSKTMKKYVTNV